ncbi:MAG: metal-dependent hydrolase [Planctomycetia bacterium]|nr:metal-dependent hydrolase [Planctomycetia bacterium]
MPGYKTHLTWSSSLGAGLGFVANTIFHVPLTQAIFGGALCALGGILPDIDSDSSLAYQRCMTTICGVTALLLASKLRDFDLESETIVLICVANYLFVMYIIGSFVKKLTAHRGMCHSIPMGIIAAELLYLMSAGDNQLRLFKAACIFFGVLIHLLLDEVYSVSIGDSTTLSRNYYDEYDNYSRSSSSKKRKNRRVVQGFRIKKSFGTAVKLIDYKHMGSTICFYIVAAILGNLALEEHKILQGLDKANILDDRGMAAVERVQTMYPSQYELSIVKWIAENDLVLSPGSNNNAKWQELQESLALNDDSSTESNDVNASNERKVTLLDIINWNSVTSSQSSLPQTDAQ